MNPPDNILNPADFNNQPNQNVNNQSFFRSIFKEFTFLFTILLLLNSFIFILGIFGIYETFDFSICDWPIRYKNQYYRIFTHNFIHLSFIHIFFNMIFFYFVGPQVEKRIGTIFTFIYIFHSVIILSIVYLMIAKLLDYFLVHFMKFKDFNYDFYCSIGFSGVLFSLFYFWCNFSSISETYQNFLLVAPIKSKFLPFCYLIFLQILNPNSSFLGHLSGIISGVLIKYFFVFFTFPNKNWIQNFENKTHNGCWANFLEKLNYKRIESVGNQDISEIDVQISDFSFIKLFKRIFNRNRINNNNNFERQQDQEN